MVLHAAGFPEMSTTGSEQRKIPYGNVYSQFVTVVVVVKVVGVVPPLSRAGLLV